MINSVGQSISSAIEANGSTGTTASASTSASPAARMAAEGAPVDMDRIAAIKAAIASGNYPVNPSVIADRMMALDLPA
jgi:negative regulator of flagellin synthesis FlgM